MVGGVVIEVYCDTVCPDLNRSVSLVPCTTNEETKIQYCCLITQRDSKQEEQNGKNRDVPGLIMSPVHFIMNIIASKMLVPSVLPVLMSVFYYQLSPITHDPNTTFTLSTDTLNLTDTTNTLNDTLNDTHTQNTHKHNTSNILNDTHIE